MMFKKFLLISILLLINCKVFGQTNIKTHANKLGNYEIGIYKKHKINAEVEVTKSDTESVKSLIIRDKNKEILYVKNYYGTSKGHRKIINISVEAVNLPENGTVLLVMTQILPSAPGSGMHGQYFCFNTLNKFVPVTGLLSPHADDAQSQHFKIVRSERLKCYMIKLERWTGNYTVVLEYRMRLEGVISDYHSYFNYSSFPVRIDDNLARKERKDNEYYYKTTIVKVYNKPDKESTLKKVNVKTESIIKFIDASRASQKDDWWIHVNIDGIEGYVTGWPDVPILGLPDAG